MTETVESAPVGGLAMTVVGVTLLLFWRVTASVARWLWQIGHVRLLAERYPQGVIIVSVILESSTAPNGALRKRMQADFKALGPAMRRMVAAPVGNSFWLSVVRTIVKGVMIMSGQSDRQRVAESLEQGIRRGEGGCERGHAEPFRAAGRYARIEERTRRKRDGSAHSRVGSVS